MNGSWYGGVCACLAGGTRLDCDSGVRCHLSPFWCIEVDHRSLMTKVVGLGSLEDGGSGQTDGRQRYERVIVSGVMVARGSFCLYRLRPVSDTKRLSEERSIWMKMLRLAHA